MPGQKELRLKQYDSMGIN